MKKGEYFELDITAENRLKARERKARLAAIDEKFKAEYPSLVKGEETRESKGLIFVTRGRCAGGGCFHNHYTRI